MKGIWEVEINRLNAAKIRVSHKVRDKHTKWNKKEHRYKRK